MTLARALTSTIGDSLTEYGGFRSTRLTTPALGELVEARGYFDASTADGTTITLAGGTWPADLTGRSLRIVSGPAAGEIVAITSRDSDTQITVASAFTLFSGAAWEVVRPAATVLAVETAAGWEAAAELWIDGYRYRYAARTDTTFTGIEHHDGVGWTAGVAKTHDALTEVVDFSRAFSWLDHFRRTFLVETAAGEELTTLAANLGVSRPEALSDDDTFRALVQAIAYTWKGTARALELALDALLGAGNWEMFVDLTGTDELNETCTVFLRRTDESETVSPAGKAFVEGAEETTLATSTTMALDAEPDTVASVRYRPEYEARLISEGDGANSALDALTVTGPTFGAAVQPGDRFTILSGPKAGFSTIIGSVDSATQITLRDNPGLVSLAAWRIERDRTDATRYLPSADDSPPYDGASAVAQWTWDSNTTEPSVTAGSGTPITRTASGYSVYRRDLRILPEDTAHLEVHFALSGEGTEFGTAATDGAQLLTLLSDGTKVAAAGFIEESGNAFGYFGFINPATGEFLNAIRAEVWGARQSDGSWAYDPGQPGTWRIEKHGEDVVELWYLPADGTRAWLLADRVSYSSLPDVSTWTAAAPYTAEARELAFGLADTGVSGQPTMLVKHVRWSVEPAVELANTRGLSGSGSNQTLTGPASTFDAGDVGKYVTIHGISDLNSEGGSARGTWKIDTVNSGTEAVVTGRTELGGRFSALNRDELAVIEDDPFVWPDHRGHVLQILNGPNAGSYQIDAILDPDTGETLDAVLPSEWVTAAGAFATYDEAPRVRSNRVRLVGAGSTVPTFDLDGPDEVAWRMAPFMDDSGLTFDLAGAVSFSGTTVTLRNAAALPVGTPVVVQRSKTPTSYLLHTSETVGYTEADGFTHWPFYLHDRWGYIRTLLQGLTAAGVILDFDSLERDAAGLHVVPEYADASTPQPLLTQTEIGVDFLPGATLVGEPEDPFGF